MSDLDQLLDTLVADVRSQTRAPGAPKAIERGRRRRRLVTGAGAVAAVAVIAAGSALAAGTLGGSESPSSFAVPPTASPEPSAEGEYPIYEALTSVPGWDISDEAVEGPVRLDPCGVRFGNTLGGVGSGTNRPFPFKPPGGLPIRYDEVGFGIPASAPIAMDQILANLRSCTAASWRTQPIGQTGAVLAFTDSEVVWFFHKNAHVRWLHVPTTDGPPPLAVQVKVANQMYSYMK